MRLHGRSGAPTVGVETCRGRGARRRRPSHTCLAASECCVRAGGRRSRAAKACSAAVVHTEQEAREGPDRVRQVTALCCLVGVTGFEPVTSHGGVCARWLGLARRSGLLVFPVALGHALGDLSVAFGCGVLVAHRGGGCGVAEAVHQLGEGGAGLGGEDGAGRGSVGLVGRRLRGRGSTSGRWLRRAGVLRVMRGSAARWRLCGCAVAGGPERVG